MFYFWANYVIWLIMAVVDCVICGLAFDPKKKEKSRWRYIFGMVAVNLPFLHIKFLCNDQTTIRSLCILAMTGTTLIALTIFFDGTFWQKLLFRISNLVACLFAELVLMVIMRDELVIPGHTLTFYDPIMLKADLID